MGCVWEGICVNLFFRDVKEFTGHQSQRPQTLDGKTVDHGVWVLPGHRGAFLGRTGLESRFPVLWSGCHFSALPRLQKRAPIKLLLGRGP